MAIIDIKKLYNNIYSADKFCSTFCQCSYDDSNNVYLVDNNTPCINFDEIKKSVNSSLASADSLFFSSKTDSCLFIEFKNQPIRNASLNIGKSAADSLYIHCRILSDNNCLSSITNNIFVAVLASNKNDSFFNTPVAAMVRRSQISGNPSLFSFEESKNISRERMSREYPSFADYYYSSFIPVLSDSFNSFMRSF